MKKISILSTAAIILAIACLVLVFIDQRIIASILGLFAYLTAMIAVKNESAPWQIWTFLGVAVIFGYSLCPKGGFFCMAACTTLLALVVSLRLLLFEKLLYSKMRWIEPVLFIGGISYYVIGNIYDGSGWMSWTFPAPPMALATLIVVGGIKGAKEFDEKSNRQYNAQVGKPAPPFSLPDQNGKTVNLADFKDKRNVLLIFVRGDWCPTCHIMLRSYEKNKNKFAEKNVMILAIGPDPIGVNREMVTKLGVDYKVLSDDKHVATKAYGMALMPNANGTKYEEGSPLPASFLIDIKGNIAYTSNPDRVGEILNPGTIFPVLEALSA